MLSRFHLITLILRKKTDPLMCVSLETSNVRSEACFADLIGLTSLCRNNCVWCLGNICNFSNWYLGLTFHDVCIFLYGKMHTNWWKVRLFPGNETTAFAVMWRCFRSRASFQLQQQAESMSQKSYTINILAVSNELQCQWAGSSVA